MALELYNTLTRTKEKFFPLNPPKVSLYTCGPTVYNIPHIGNYRAYIFADILRRTLAYNHYEVMHVMNLTDVDDKTIRDSQAAKKSLKEFTELYTNEFFKDRDTLNIIPAVKYTKATDYISQMVALTETLLAKEYAYRGDDGSIYFNIKKDPSYGKLSNITIEKLEDNASGRIKKDEYDKENAQDFALWKMWDEADGDVFWETPLGKGRPGWHIECSAMSMTTLGETLDIHTGGMDNMFPHHENEIAQSECATGKPFSRFFLHNGLLLVDGKKMSKSLGNFYSLRDLIDKGYDPLAYRLWLLTSHYRTLTNFSLEALKGSETALKRLYREFLALDSQSTTGHINEAYKEKFLAFINDDLDTPRALTVMWDILKDTAVSDADKKATLLDFDKVLGLKLADQKEEPLSEEVKTLARRRKEARIKKDFKESDTLRKQIEELGYEVKDTEDGQEIHAIL